ncbi:MAG: DUF3857 domain-containing protein, partial [Terriglobales bacterium]
MAPAGVISGTIPAFAAAALRPEFDVRFLNHSWIRKSGLAGCMMSLALATAVWGQAAPTGAGWQAVPAVVRRHLGADQAWTPSGTMADASAAVLREVTSWRLEPDGAIATHALTEFKVLTALGASQLGNLPVFYRGDTTLQSVQAFVINGGQVQTPAPDAIHDYASRLAQTAPMYTDLRERIITLPSVTAGTLIVLDVRSRQLRQDDPGELTMLRSLGRMPILRRTVTITLPPGRRLVFAESAPLAPGAGQMTFRHSQHATAAGQVYQFQWADIPAADPEAYSAPAPPMFTASTFGSWASVAHWYYRLAAPQAAPDAAIGAEAAKLTAGQTTRAGKIKALYDYVAANFRYVSLSFGVGRYRPHAAAQVMRNGYGDCKDKAALLIALLRAAGIRAEFALLDSGGRLQRAVPAASGFDHAIVAVPDGAGYQFLDATVPERPGALLGDTGHWVLLALPPGAAGPWLVRIPPAIAADRETAETDSIVAAANGDMTADCLLRFGPALALVSRLALHLAPLADQQHIQQLLARADASDTHLVSFHATSWPGLDRPFTLHTVRRMTAAASVLQPPFSVPLWWHIVANALPQSSHSRLAPLRLDRLLPAYRQTIRLTLPAGFIPVLPSATTLTPGFARFSLHFSFDAASHVLTAAGELVWLRAELPAAQVGDYQRFQQAVNNAEADSISLTLAPGAAAPMLASSLRQLHQDLAQGDAAGAVALGQGLIAVAPSNATAREDLAAAWLAEKQYKKALAVLDPLRAHPPATGRVPALLAAAQLGMGQAADALLEVQTQLRATPYDASATGLEGRILDALGRRRAAAQAYARAVQLAPDEVEWRYRLGRDQLALGQHAVAEGNFQQVAASPEATGEELLGMGAAELAAGAPIAAAANWAEQGLSQTGAALSNLDWSHLTAAERAAMKQLPGAVELCARLQAQQQQWKQALALGQLAVALDPGQAQWVERLARWERRVSGPAAAIPYWAYLLAGPHPPADAMQKLEADYQALPQHSSLPVDLYLAAHPELARPRFGGRRLSPVTPETAYAVAWVVDGHVASINGFL